ETASDNREVYLIGKRERLGREIYRPRRHSPRMGFARHCSSLMPAALDRQNITYMKGRRGFRWSRDVPAHSLFCLIRSLEERANRTAATASTLTRRGNHTGEVHGRGIRNRTSGSRKDSGQRTVAQSAA